MIPIALLEMFSRYEFVTTSEVTSAKLSNFFFYRSLFLRLELIDKYGGHSRISDND